MFRHHKFRIHEPVLSRPQPLLEVSTINFAGWLAKISVCCHYQNVKISVLILIGRILLECVHSSVLVIVKSGLGALCFSSDTQNRPTWDFLKNRETLSKMIVFYNISEKVTPERQEEVFPWNQGSVTVLITTQYWKLFENLIYLTLKKPINQFFTLQNKHQITRKKYLHETRFFF